MSPKFYQTSEFRALDAEWAQRLKDDGFEDIEADGELVQSAEERNAKKVLRRNPARALALADYYTEAERALSEHRFDTPSDRAVWAHHARGMTEHEVARLMRLPRTTVQKKLQKYRKRFGLVRPR